MGPHQPLAAVHAMPLPGRIAAWTSPGKDRFTLATTLGRPAPIGRLVSPVHAWAGSETRTRLPAQSLSAQKGRPALEEADR